MKKTSVYKDIDQPLEVHANRLALDMVRGINTGDVPYPLASSIQQDATHRFVTDAERISWTLAAEGVLFVHPDTHPPSIIEQDATHRFVTDVQIAAWNSGGGVAGPGTIIGDGIGAIVYNPVEPTTPQPGDIWLDPNDNGSSIGGGGLLEVPPDTPQIGDIWLDPNAGGTLDGTDTGVYVPVIYDPIEPGAPSVGDVWLDPNADGGTTSNVPAIYDPEEPQAPVIGDLWLDPNADTGGAVLYDPVAPVTPVAGDIWVDPNEVSADIADLDAGIEVFLERNGIGVRNYTAETNINLNVQTGEGIYEIMLLGESNQVVANTDVDALLLPIGSLRVGEFVCESDPSADGFLLSPGVMIQGKLEVSTFTKNKSILLNSLVHTTGLFTSGGFGLWNDVTTEWTSLGTLVLPFAQTGKVIVRRIL